MTIKTALGTRRFANHFTYVLVALACLLGGFQGLSDCLPPPGGVVGWWPGDNSARDIAGTNNGTLVSGSFGTGEVGRAFVLDGTNGYVTIPHSAVLNPSGAFSV